MTMFLIENEGTVEQIRRNDPNLTILVLKLNDLANINLNVPYGAIGHYIGQNTSIQEILLRDYRPPHAQNEDHGDCPFFRIPAQDREAFFAGISRSPTAKTIAFNACSLEGPILKMFRIPNLEYVRFRGVTITQDAVSAVRRAYGLRRIMLSGSMSFDDANRADFFASLNHIYKLEHVTFCSFCMEQHRYTALSDMFSDPKSAIKELRLTWCEPQVLIGIRNGLVHSSSLEVLNLSGTSMTRETWQVVSDALSSRVAGLKDLGVNDVSIEDENADALASGLANNNTIEKLCLSRIRRASWVPILSSLQNPNLLIKRIEISDVEGFSDEVVSFLAVALIAHSDTIEQICLESCLGITSAGWTLLSSALSQPMPNLIQLWLEDADFDEFACITVASGLCNKSSLKSLALCQTDMTPAGWYLISKSLCDTSSIDAIRGSNHTLREISFANSTSLSPRISKCLKMNRMYAASKVARLKVVEFYDGINIESLVNDLPELQLKISPSVMSWLGSDRCRHTALFRFVRNQAFLLEFSSSHVSL
ncbi:hypothetical protein ACHAW6_006156 [Cyclotella cf. meneghiniana]